MAYRHIMAQKSESRELDKVIVRLPDGMRDRIKAAAEANNRSMNAEIVEALEEIYPPPFSPQEIHKMIKASLVMFDAQRRGVPPGVPEKNREFVLRVLREILHIEDSEKALQKIESETANITDISLERFILWQRNMMQKLDPNEWPLAGD